MQGFKSTVIVGVVSALVGLLAGACSVEGITDVAGPATDASPVPDQSRSDATTSADSAPKPEPADDAALEAAVVFDAGVDAPDTAPGTCNAVLFFGPIGLPDCDTCLTNNCCAITQACLQDADCNALSNCAFACDGDDAGACTTACQLQHPSSAGKLSGWLTCMGDMCKGFCS